MSISQIIEGLGSVELALGFNEEFQKLIDKYTGKFNNVINQIRTANAKLDIISDLYAKNLEKQITRNEMEIYKNTNENNAVLFKKPVNKNALREGKDEIYKYEMDKAKKYINDKKNQLIPDVGVMLSEVNDLKGFAEGFGKKKYGEDFIKNIASGKIIANPTTSKNKENTGGNNEENKTESLKEHDVTSEDNPNMSLRDLSELDLPEAQRDFNKKYIKMSDAEFFERYLPKSTRPDFFTLNGEKSQRQHLTEFFKCIQDDPKKDYDLERDSSDEPNTKIINLGGFINPVLNLCNSPMPTLTATTIFISNKRMAIFKEGDEFYLKLKGDSSPQWYTCKKTELYRDIDSMFGNPLGDDSEQMEVKIRITFDRKGKEESYNIKELCELNEGSNSYATNPPFTQEIKYMQHPVCLIKKRFPPQSKVGGKKTKKRRRNNRKTMKKARRKSGIRRK